MLYRTIRGVQSAQQLPEIGSIEQFSEWPSAEIPSPYSEGLSSTLK
jgi:hypothetical protein